MNPSIQFTLPCPLCLAATSSGTHLVVALKVGLLLQAVHEVLKHLLGDGRHAVGPPLVVHDVQPDVVLLVNVVLHLLVQLLHRLVNVPLGAGLGRGGEVTTVMNDHRGQEEVGWRGFTGSIR